MLDPVLEAFKKLGLPAIRNDDFFDRLSRRYSMIILGISFIIVTTSHFIGDPIHCFTQMVDSKHKADYVNWVCWISSSYYLPFDKPLPNRNQARPERMFVQKVTSIVFIHMCHFSPYYQWVPFILFIMMMLFYIPGFIWRKMNKSCGMDAKVVTHMMSEMDPLNTEKRKEAMNALAKHIDTALAYHRDYHHGFM